MTYSDYLNISIDVRQDILHGRSGSPDIPKHTEHKRAEVQVTFHTGVEFENTVAISAK
jgi:hypothetical protein